MGTGNCTKSTVWKQTEVTNPPGPCRLPPAPPLQVASLLPVGMLQRLLRGLPMALLSPSIPGTPPLVTLIHTHRTPGQPGQPNPPTQQWVGSLSLRTTPFLPAAAPSPSTCFLPSPAPAPGMSLPLGCDSSMLSPPGQAHSVYSQLLGPLPRALPLLSTPRRQGQGLFCSLLLL